MNVNIIEQVSLALQKLLESGSWNEDDELEVKIGGMRISGLSQTDSKNPKWSPNYGDTKYNPDAFIVIQNITKRGETK